jgi:phosphoglycolate phosphatase-like HAD superfamily hydrolase
MLNLKKYNKVVFDCDGIILDSNDVKSKAFAKSLIGSGNQSISEFIDYHKKNGGVSRFVKFEYFFKVLKNQENYQKDLNIALRKYSELSYKGLLDCGIIPGVKNILKFLHNQNIDCFVISGGEQSEVRTILEKRGLSVFFKKIYGSPITKKEHLNKLKLSNALYFGDSWSDYDAAKDFGIDFIYISNASEWKYGIKFCKENKIPYYGDFNDIKYSK